MFRMVTHQLLRHRYTLAVGLPVIVLLATSLSFIRSPYDVYLVPEDGRFVAVGEQVTLQVNLASKQPINVVSGTIAVPMDKFVVERIAYDGSIIDLWAEEPVLKDGELRFAGGVVSPTGFTGSGTLFTLTLRPLEQGKASVLWGEAHVLAHDGQGTELTSKKSPIILSVREASAPSPDINGDAQVNLIDFGIVSSRLFLAYEAQYDLDQDGKITLADLAIIISNMADSTRLGGLVLFWS